jgi:hypothetical protein
MATAMDSRNRLVAGSPPHMSDSQAFLNETWYVGRQRNVSAIFGCVQIYRSMSCLVVRTSAFLIKLRIVS